MVEIEYFLTIGKTCPSGMVMIYGKCIGVVSNTESDEGTHDNCNWNSDSLSYRLATFDNIKVLQEFRDIEIILGFTI